MFFIIPFLFGVGVGVGDVGDVAMILGSLRVVILTW